MELMKINPAKSKATAINWAHKSEATVAYAAKSKVSGNWVTIHCYSECSIGDMKMNGPGHWSQLIRVKPSPKINLYEKDIKALSAILKGS